MLFAIGRPKAGAGMRQRAALAKVRAGDHGFDIVVPSANYMPTRIEEELLLETRTMRFMRPCVAW